jgi:hypothetical protein
MIRAIEIPDKPLNQKVYTTEKYKAFVTETIDLPCGQDAMLLSRKCRKTGEYNQSENPLFGDTGFWLELRLIGGKYDDRFVKCFQESDGAPWKLEK